MDEKSWFDLRADEKTALATEAIRDRLGTVLEVLRGEFSLQGPELKSIAEETKLVRHLLSNPDDSRHRETAHQLVQIKWILAALLALLLWRSF